MNSEICLLHASTVSSTPNAETTVTCSDFTNGYELNEQKPTLEINLSSATLIDMDIEMSVSCSVKETITTDNEIKDTEMHAEMHADIGEMCFLETTGSTVMPLDTVVLPAEEPRKVIDTSSEFRHGISRYAPYGTRFAARMKDGEFKTSHIAGDLANRARCKNGKGGRVDLILVTHEGEKQQLETALAFYEEQVKESLKPGPSEVLNHLKDANLDWDYRKGDGEKLLQRNASNFFKRMMEHARRVGHRLAPPSSPAPVKPTVVKKPKYPEPDVNEAAAILGQLMNARSDNTSDVGSCTDTDIEMSEQVSYQSFESMVESETTVTSLKRKSIDWSLPKHHKGSFFAELCKFAAIARKEETEFYSKAAEVFDWKCVPQVLPEIEATDVECFESDDFIPVFQKKRKIKIQQPKQVKPVVQRPMPTYQPTEPVPSFSVVADNPKPVIRKSKEGASGFMIKGLSRHSPYGTRFCAMMPNGEMRESFLAGDLSERAKGPDGKSQGELILVLHPGEIKQLEMAWEYVQTQDQHQIGAGVVLEYLRSLDLDHNHRKSGTKLLQKNAGNFFKRVQEYGRRKAVDPTYLSL